MPMMKEIWTPMKWIGVRYFKDKHQNVYYKKVRNRNRVPTKPFWTYKPLIVLVAAAILGGGGYGGYRYAMNKISDQLLAEVSKEIDNQDVQKMLKDPDVQKALKERTGTGDSTAVADSDNAASQNASMSADKQQVLSQPVSADPSSGQAAKTSKQNEASSGQTGNSAEKTTQTKSDRSTGSNSGIHFHSKQEATRFVLSKFSVSELYQMKSMYQKGEKEEVKSKVFSRLSPAEIKALEEVAAKESKK
ncbi:hypothetical protein ABE218_08875 [Bacillus smithii]|uniref:hypothetical protein n=1 Tax=Bacillus smithii TaxID=1479 RepID=UPI003D21DDDE